MLVTLLYSSYFVRYRKMNGELLLMKISRVVDDAFVEHLKWQTHTNLFRNKYIDVVTGRSLVWLLGFE